jgi:hypothetical protein
MDELVSFEKLKGVQGKKMGYPRIALEDSLNFNISEHIMEKKLKLAPIKIKKSSETESAYGGSKLASAGSVAEIPEEIQSDMTFQK